MDDKGRGRISMLTIYERICKEFKGRLTEQCYTKPKKWVIAAGLTLATLVGGSIGELIGEYRHNLALEKANIEAAAKIKIICEEYKRSTEENIARIKASYSKEDTGSLNQKISEAEKKASDAEAKAAGLQQRLDSALANLETSANKLNEQMQIFNDYQKDHPAELTKAVYDALRATSTDGQKQLSDVLANLETVRAEFDVYKKTHPTDVSKEVLEALQKDRESLINLSKSYSELTQNLRTLEQTVTEGKKAFEIYKKDHPEEITLDLHNSVLNQLTDIKNKLKASEGIEQETNRKLTEAVAALEKYKETHPEEITQEAYASLDSQLTIAMQAADKAKSALDMYVKTHPEELTQEHYEAMKKQWTDVRKELSDARIVLQEANKSFEEHKQKEAAFIQEKKTLEDTIEQLNLAKNSLTDQLSQAKKALEEYMKAHPEVIAKETPQDAKSSTYTKFIEILKKLESEPVTVNHPRLANLSSDLETIRRMHIDILKDGVINPITGAITTSQGLRSDEITALLRLNNQLHVLHLKYGHTNPYIGKLSALNKDCIETFISSNQMKGCAIIVAKDKANASTIFFGYEYEPLFLSGTLARQAETLHLSIGEAIEKHRNEEEINEGFGKKFKGTGIGDTADAKSRAILGMGLVVPRENWTNLPEFFPNGELKNKTGERITRNTYEMMLKENEILSVYLIYATNFPRGLKYIHDFVTAINTRTLSQFESLLNKEYKDSSYIRYEDIRKEMFNAVLQEYILINPFLKIGLGAIWTEDNNNAKCDGFPHDAPSHTPLLTVTLQELAERLSIQRAADYLKTAYGKKMTYAQMKEYIRTHSIANFASELSQCYLLLSKEEAATLDKDKKLNLQEGINYHNLQIIARDIPLEEE